MELEQKGLLKEKTLKFGKVNALKDIIFKIANKNGIGAELSEGARIFARNYNSPESAIEVKGLELPAYDPRGAVGHALGYATSTRGGCHLTGYMASLEIFAAPKKVDRFTIGGKPDLLALKQNQKAAEDSLVICAFAGWSLGLDFYARFLKAITGIEYDIATLTEIGERIYTIERLFNLREGLSKKDDSLPPRFLNTPLKYGNSKDHIVPLDVMLEQYYYVREWNENGIPKTKLIQRLNIDFNI
jgi:aldehyde:ferredoxin oxidoreductase